MSVIQRKLIDYLNIFFRVLEILAPFVSSVAVDLPKGSVYSEVVLPRVLSHALVVYRLAPHFENGCIGESGLHPF